MPRQDSVVECLCVALSPLNGDTGDTTRGPLLIYIMKELHAQAVQNVSE